MFSELFTTALTHVSEYDASTKAYVAFVDALEPSKILILSNCYIPYFILPIKFLKFIDKNVYSLI